MLAAFRPSYSPTKIHQSSATENFLKKFKLRSGAFIEPTPAYKLLAKNRSSRAKDHSISFYVQLSEDPLKIIS
jgi:hypothetical protein